MPWQFLEGRIKGYEVGRDTTVCRETKVSARGANCCYLSLQHHRHEYVSHSDGDSFASSHAHDVKHLDNKEDEDEEEEESNHGPFIIHA